MATPTPGSKNASRELPIRLLIVDDEEAIRFGCAEYFKSRGFVVNTAADLAAAEQCLVARQYDVVISDLRLTGVSAVEGLDVLVRARDAQPRVHTVLISAYITPQVEREAQIRRVDRVERKPMSAVALERTVLEVLGRS